MRSTLHTPVDLVFSYNPVARVLSMKTSWVLELESDYFFMMQRSRRRDCLTMEKWPTRFFLWRRWSAKILEINKTHNYFSRWIVPTNILGDEQHHSFSSSHYFLVWDGRKK